MSVPQGRRRVARGGRARKPLASTGLPPHHVPVTETTCTDSLTETRVLASIANGRLDVTALRSLPRLPAPPR